MLHRSRIGANVPLLVLVSCAASTLASREAHAHTEPMHAVATLLARHYVKMPYVTAKPRAVGAATVGRLNAAAREVEAVENGAVKVPDQLKTERYRLLGVEELDGAAQAVELRPDRAPVREDPGLSGYGAGRAEFPRQRPGALLGFLVANVDTHQDTWVSAKSPYQFVAEQIEDELSVCNTDSWLLQSACGLAALPFTLGNAFARVSRKCSISPLSVVSDSLSCALGLRRALKDIGGAFAAIAPGLFAEMVAEDHISGCWGSDSGAGAVVDALVDQETATASITPGYDGVSPAEERALRDDSAFYGRYGVSRQKCDLDEEYLPNIQKFVTPGRPLTSQDLILSTRARFLDFMLSPASPRGIVFGADSSDRRIASHFRALEPWFWSAEASKRVAGGGPYVLPDYKRWRMESFTMVNHFFNVLGPDGRRLDSALKDGIDHMKSRAVEAGEAHAFGGLSLAHGKRFLPATSTRATKGLEHGRRDEVSQQAARMLQAHPEPTSHYVTLRRRVCPTGQGPSLPTTDGLPTSDCSVAVPKSTGGTIIERAINAPADLGALDGFDQWMNAGPDAALRMFGETYPYFGSHSPFVRDLGRELKDMNSCETSACRETASGVSHATEYQRFADRAPRDHGDAMRLRGLALAAHMIQDLTVPHHIASTVAYSHQYYEEFFANYIYPLLPSEVDVRHFYTQPVVLGAEGPSGTTATYAFPKPVAIGDTTSGFVAKPHADPDALLDAVVRGMAVAGGWDRVDQEFLRLGSLMAKLATESCPATKFSTRRLAWATAYRTAELIREASATVGADMSGSGYDRAKSEIDPAGFWVASSIPESGRTEPALSLAELARPTIVNRGPQGWSHTLTKAWTKSAEFAQEDDDAASRGGKIHRSIAMPTWKTMAESSFPLLIASTAHLLLGAGEARSNSASTCDGGFYTVRARLPESFPVPTSEAASCARRVEASVSACLSDPTVACGPFADIPAVMTCAKSSPDGRSALGCANLEDIVTRCTCDSGHDKANDTLNTCVGMELFQQAIRELVGDHRITGRTAMHQYRSLGLAMFGPPLPDQDGDGIDDEEDECKTDPPRFSGKLPNTTISSEVCLLGDACRYGCLSHSTSPR